MASAPATVDFEIRAVADRPRAGDPSHARIFELDGFRATAVLLVLAHHLVYGWLPTADGISWMPRIFTAILSHGWLGVDLFFVLSGFLITGILLDSRESKHYFRNFYIRRALRILPLYFICIFVMSLVYHGAATYFVLSLLFLANFAYAFHANVPSGPDVFWSLAVEEHFYLLWPLLVRFLTGVSLFVLTLIIVFGTPILRGVCAYWGMHPGLEIYHYSFFRFDGMALGAILALWVRSRYYSRESAWKLAGFLIGFALLVTAVGWPYGIMETKSIASAALRYTQAQFGFAAAMALALAYRGTPATGFLRSRFARLTADLSYCIYLIHTAVGDGYYWVLGSLQFNDVAHFGAVGALAVRSLVIATATFGVAVLSKKYLEDPFLRLKRYFSYPDSVRTTS
jgi:peptidoglycan/LPS O-acetylase OafA/YrhL